MHTGSTHEHVQPTPPESAYYSLNSEEARAYNKDVVMALPASLRESLINPPQDFITRVHITDQSGAENIRQHGYMFEGYVGPDALNNTTKALARPGIEAPDGWTDEDVVEYNIERLSGLHGGASCIVVIRIPDPEMLGRHMKPTMQGENILDGVEGRRGEWWDTYRDYLDKLLINPVTGQGLAPPDMIEGYLNRATGEWVQGSKFSSGHAAYRQ